MWQPAAFSPGAGIIRTFIAAAFLVASLLVVPSGAAVCTPVGCVGSSGQGSCDEGYAFNYVQSYDPDSGNGANASTYCTGSGPYGFNVVRVGASACPVECVGVSVVWSSSGDSCQTTAMVRDGEKLEYHALGCPAGPTPAVPRLPLP